MLINDLLIARANRDVSAGSGDGVGPYWNHSSAVVGAHKDFHLTFVATMNVGIWEHYHMAIDNIMFAPECAAVASINQVPPKTM